MLEKLTNVGFKVWTSDVREICEKYNMDIFYNLKMFTFEQERICVNREVQQGKLVWVLVLVLVHVQVLYIFEVPLEVWGGALRGTL
jgi:hypothetical protein